MKVRWRAWVWLPVLGLLIAGVLRLRFDVEVLNLLPGDLPVVEGLKLYQQNFSNARELILTIRARSADAAEQAAERVAVALRQLTNEVSEVTWRQPWLEAPHEAAELVGYLWINQPPAIFSSLTNQLLGSNATARLQLTREQLTTSLSPAEVARLSRDPFNLLELPPEPGSAEVFGLDNDLFSSTDGRFRLLFVRAASDLASYRACQAWLNRVHDVVAQLQKGQALPTETVIRYTGRPVFVAEIAGGMEADMHGSVLGTVVIIALLFFAAHRTWRPLLWLIVMLLGILAGTLAIGGLVFGALNVVSAGFAAVLLGLAVDYALVLYQEYRASPGESVNEVRAKVAPSIRWSALTTAGAFLLLNLGGLPGLAQLGSLVGLGVGLAALVMLYGFLPLAAKSRAPSSHRSAVEPVLRRATPQSGRAAWITAAALVALAGAALAWRLPTLDHSPDALRPRASAAYATLAELRTEMNQNKEPWWLIVAGESKRQVAERLQAAVAVLTAAHATGAIESFRAPSRLWPNARHQQANRSTALAFLSWRDELREAALGQGFTSEALAGTEAIFDTWQRAVTAREAYRPTNHLTQWLFNNFSAASSNQLLTLSLVYPAKRAGNEMIATMPDWTKALPAHGVWLTGWDLLGEAILQLVERDLWRVLIPMALLLMVALWSAFRTAAEMALSLLTLLLSGLCLLAVMALAGWSWNLLNLMALPLLIGAGIDYSLHMQLGLRRHGADIRATRRIVGRALLLCASTTAAGFGSLAWASNAGLSSLGQVCAAGVASTCLVSIYLLPGWWSSWIGGKFAQRRASNGPPHSHQGPHNARPTAQSDKARPSAFYRSSLWQVGRWAAMRLPVPAAHALSRLLANLYWRLNGARREVVIRNLTPVLEPASADPGQLSRQLFQQFACKVLDLWRYENGQSIQELVNDGEGWEHLDKARQRGRGILLVTPHLGNWELGAPLLAARGIAITVITSDEPEARLTELRRLSRARWGIETLVIGQDPFAFVELIRRLENGGAVALLVDRPAPSSAVNCRLFDRPFAASIAPAELARASGCSIIPVCLPRLGAGYRAEVLPEVVYDRATLGSRAARIELTQQIMRAFEPRIRQYVAQWYHFVPIWPERP